MTDFEKNLLDPPSKYRPVPFWSWNEKLQTEETRRQIRLMKEAGFGGFFMHARGGLQTEYLSDEWFDNVLASIDEGEKCDMSAWGYDENGWPSGSGNGIVTALGIEYRQKYLRCVKTETPVEDDKTLSNVRIGGENYHCYYEVNPYYIDTLNPDVVREFLNSTHEKYRQKLKGDFKKMRGFFTDEPQASRNGIPWSFNLQKEYRRLYKEDIKDQLPKLFYRLAGFEEFRFRFWKLVRDLFADSFMGVIGAWCSINGSKLTGHMVLEEDYYEHILANGSCMPSYEFMDIPGMDHIGRELPAVQTEMQLSSVAHQLGKKQILSETFAACGWNISFEDMRRIYEHQMVHGVNLLCQHLEGYSLRGIRKRDYPASIFVQQPWWNDYRAFNDMVSRIGMLLSEGEVCFNILVLSTIESGWLLTDDRDEADGYSDKLHDVMNCLEDAHLQYHLGDSRIIMRHGNVVEGRFCIGKQRYSTVVVPDAKCIDEDVFNMLCEFKKQGGTVVFCEEIPEYINGIRTQKVVEFAKNCLVANREKISEVIPGKCRLLSVKTVDISQKRFIRSTVRRFADRQMTMCYICNFDDKESSITVEMPGKSAVRFDAVGGKTSSANYEKDGNNVRIKCVIPSNSSVVFFVYDNKEYPSGELKTDIKTDISAKLKGEWKINETDDNSLTLDYCDLSVDGRLLLKNIPVSEVQEILCSYRKPVNVKIDFGFSVRDLDFSVCELMIETPEIFDIVLNGAVIEKTIIGFKHDRSFKLIDIYDHLKIGENIISLSCVFTQSEKTYRMLDEIKSFISNKNRLSYDMEIEAIYLKGDFGVYSEREFEKLERGALKTKGGFYIGKAPTSVLDGPLETQGFTFFAGSVILVKKISLSSIEAQNAVISFEKLPGIISEVKVNGNSAGKIMWKPYCLDVSGFAREGENEIEIILTGSLRNLLGPFHLEEGETYSALPFYFFKKTGIWGWGDGVNHKWTDDYSFVQNGLFFK